MTIIIGARKARRRFADYLGLAGNIGLLLSNVQVTL
jgi:hypothetical protein